MYLFHPLKSAGIVSSAYYNIVVGCHNILSQFLAYQALQAPEHKPWRDILGEKL